MLLLLFSHQHICSLSLTYMSNIRYQMLDIRHLNNHYSKKKMCFFKVKMKEWHFRLPSFWQSDSPRNVFCLILVDFPQLLLPLLFHYNLRSSHYLIEFPTLFWMCSNSITAKLVILPVFEHVQWQLSPKRAQVIFKFSN